MRRFQLGGAGGDPGGFIILPDNSSEAAIKQAQSEVDEEFGQAEIGDLHLAAHAPEMPDLPAINRGADEDEQPREQQARGRDGCALARFHR